MQQWQNARVLQPQCVQPENRCMLDFFLSFFLPFFLPTLFSATPSIQLPSHSAERQRPAAMSQGQRLGGRAAAWQCCSRPPQAQAGFCSVSGAREAASNPYGCSKQQLPTVQSFIELHMLALICVSTRWLAYSQTATPSLPLPPVWTRSHAPGWGGPAQRVTCSPPTLPASPPSLSCLPKPYTKDLIIRVSVGWSSASTSSPGRKPCKGGVKQEEGRALGCDGWLMCAGGPAPPPAGRVEALHRDGGVSREVE